ncbi:MAG TPA: YfhO family protein [Acidimicrobiia bacterium]|nr:YfhO family protein [Acidimicrobiia bacterium]
MARWRLGAVIAAPVLAFADFVVRGRPILPGDGFIYYLPLHVLAARSWRAGHLPVWNPFSFAGSPLLGVGQAGVFYPANAAFALLSVTAANDLVVVVNFVVAGAGAFLLARRLTGDADAAVVGGLVFGLSGFLFGHVAHQSMNATVSWLPWLFYAYELLRDRLTAPRLALGGAAVGLSLVAGHSQMFLFDVGLLVLYAVFVTALDWSAGRTAPLLPAAAMIGVGAGLAAVQLLPTLAILHATRRGSALTYGQATSFSFPRSHLPLLVFPYLFGNSAAAGPFTAGYRGLWNLAELSGYPGMAALALAAAGVGAARSDRRVLALLGVAAVGLLMALGASSPLGRFVYATPFLGRFRSWGRYVVAVDLAVAVLAAYGVTVLRSAAGRARRAALLRAAAVPVAVALLAVWVHTVGSSQRFVVGGRTAVLALTLPLAAAIAGVGCSVLLAGRRRGAVAVTAAVVALDVIFCFGGFFEWRGASPSPAALERALSRRIPAPFGPVADEPGGIDRYLFAGADLAAIPEQSPLTDVKGIRSANGSEALAPAGYLQATGVSQAGEVRDATPLWAAGSRILDLLRVTTVLVDPRSTRPMPDPARFAAGGPVSGSRLVRYEYRPALPDAFVVGEARLVTRAAAVARLQGREPFDPAATALIEGDCRRCTDGRQPGRAGTVQRIGWRTASVDVDVTADRPGIVVVSQAWFPGWRATVDGHSAPVVRVDGVVQGVPLGAGPHRVRLVYRAPGLRAGAAVTALTAMGLVLALAVGRRRARPGAQQPSGALFRRRHGSLRRLPGLS